MNAVTEGLAGSAPRTPAIELVGVHQVYGTGDGTVHALRGIDLVVQDGEYVAVMGPSGSGKSTLMNILGCLDVPTDGRYRLGGTDVAAVSDDAIARIRNRELGFVFQSFNLVQRMTAVANVALPLAYAGVGRRDRTERALAALDRVGLADRADHQPQALSGGQQQRVAIARALVTEPTLVLADEPTGNLDSTATAEVLDLLDSLVAERRTIVVITHEDDVAERAHRVLTLADGRITADRPGTTGRSAHLAGAR
ncbi:ABC transporter ATP-binding protein [Curtobacterium sp. RRHDQ10]|uniref:ABC transporter ATP-binding protein n=1 Tax=Curtobacterium phyllosphaerae TaxID=3413379 RepID=UPI003BF17A79